MVGEGIQARTRSSLVASLGRLELMDAINYTHITSVYVLSLDHDLCDNMDFYIRTLNGLSAGIKPNGFLLLQLSKTCKDSTWCETITLSQKCQVRRAWEG